LNTKLKVGDPFEVKIVLKDGCGGFFVTDDYSPLEFNFGLSSDSTPNCEVTKELSVNPNNSTELFVGITCYKSKVATFINVNWNGKGLKDMPLQLGILEPADIAYATVDCDFYVDDKASDINKICLA